MDLELPCGPAVLRAPRREDAETLARHANDRRIWLNTSNRFPHPYTVDDARRYIASVRADATPVQFVIDVDGSAVGAIGFRPGDDVSFRSAEIGYWLGVEHWGKGLVSAAVPAVTAYGFGTLDYLRIFGRVFARNAASARILEKAGYVLEGTMRCSVVKDGELLDELLYARVRDGVRPGPLT